MAIVMAFLGGLLSFFSPCILPIAPGYLGIISGSSLAELQTGGATRREVLQSTVAFIAGFTIVFTLMGVTSSYLGGLLRANRMLIAKGGGIVVILLGLHQAGWMRISWLYREKRLQPRSPVGVFGAVAAGMAFSFGWTPCVGPILGSILAVAGDTGQPVQGFLLLLIYAVGLALPFILLALGFEKVLPQLNRVKPYFRYLEWLAGGLLIVMGILLFTGGMAGISAWFIQLTGGWNLENLLPQR